MSNFQPPTPWYLRCPWCPALIEVNARGMRGGDPGAGIEAAEMMKGHVQTVHDKGWTEFLARGDSSTP